MPNFQKLHAMVSSIPVDVGGGSGLDKVCVMAGLADSLAFRTYIEIGVYRGRSFFPLAWTFAQQGGFSFGIDPYSRADAEESDLPEDVADAVRKFFEETDYDALFREVLKNEAEFGLSGHVEFIRQPSLRAVNILRSRGISSDMIHIDGNHDAVCVMGDVESYMPMLKPNGLLVLDDIDWQSVKPALKYAREKLALIYSTETYAILMNAQIDNRRTLELQHACQLFQREAYAAGTKRLPRISSEAGAARDNSRPQSKGWRKNLKAASKNLRRLWSE